MARRTDRLYAAARAEVRQRSRSTTPAPTTAPSASYSTAVWPAATPYAGSSSSSRARPSPSSADRGRRPPASGPAAWPRPARAATCSRASRSGTSRRASRSRGPASDHVRPGRCASTYSGAPFEETPSPRRWPGVRPGDAGVAAEHGAVLATTSPSSKATPSRRRNPRRSPPPRKQTSWLSGAAAQTRPAASASARTCTLWDSPSGKPQPDERAPAAPWPACRTGPCGRRRAGHQRHARARDRARVVTGGQAPAPSASAAAASASKPVGPLQPLHGFGVSPAA